MLFRLRLAERLGKTYAELVGRPIPLEIETHLWRAKEGIDGPIDVEWRADWRTARVCHTLAAKGMAPIECEPADFMPQWGEQQAGPVQSEEEMRATWASVVASWNRAE